MLFNKYNNREAYWQRGKEIKWSNTVKLEHIRWEMGRKKVNNKGTISALLKYFGLFLYDTVLFCKGEVGTMCVRRLLGAGGNQEKINAWLSYFIKFSLDLVWDLRHDTIRADCLGLFHSEVVHISDIGHDIFNLNWKFRFNGWIQVEREAHNQAGTYCPWLLLLTSLTGC